MNLRLNTLAQMVDPGSRVADIGTDHAYLPIELVKNKQINYAIASDIAKGPLQNAKDDIAEAGLQGKIETRLGPGLSTVNHNDDIDTVVIAGMGGKLITDILDDAWNKHFCFKTLILEPNIGEPGVRKWLMGHKYQIVTEKLIVESGHTYELIKARAVKKRINLSEKKILFGPYILKEKNSIFYQKWENQLAYHKKLLLDLNKAKKKDLQHINQVKQEIKLIEGELNDKS
ncbi:tRNA (adenine(22)-N(1))-methyltransferase [Lactobacillus acetotolerans]|jgi:tRNA (adenine22-N1)-methyltransferase|uniref:tRNA (adenine(22)-N(1))-methyltransferase n=1 Tax=Lactobacillus acetotolerans TaxID=1600 RepID=UPI000E818704|nr:class I SAM-dependent methyltransferase [Lactobacillus acetotolerans]QJD73570.1 SAM-dependent methyltransferase [Lactobacillus acetotolerans]HBG91303.1 SAM-dependent methyltransferase [Lactobacillus acetotolerans]HBQ43687.1 SAM-dependent methyltransferase [Lactobacillus acetotolerans]HCX40256.1 SAM-dependent methyltransferase [Lactobacillus acetotolerans]